MYHTTTVVAERYGIAPEKVLEWIRSGELIAINVAQGSNGQRPRWRIAEAELEAFELRRQ